MSSCKVASASKPFDVYFRGKWVNTVYYTWDFTAKEVYKSLVNHGGFDPAIRVVARQLAKSRQ